jgi:hypothetical protein
VVAWVPYRIACASEASSKEPDLKKVPDGKRSLFVSGSFAFAEVFLATA